METIIFNQASVFHLHKIANQLKALTGERHKLSDNDSIFAILNQCSTSSNRQLRLSFAHFLEQLDDSQRDALKSKGMPF